MVISTASIISSQRTQGQSRGVSVSAFDTPVLYCLAPCEAEKSYASRGAQPSGMFTPPRHFAIPACPPHPSSSSSSSSSTLRPTILYRGAIPDTRNIPFLRRLKLKTILVLSPKVPKETEVVHDDRPVPAPSGGTGKKAGNGDGAMEGGGDNMVQKQRTRLTPIGRLKRREGVDVRWVKVDKMGEEKLGMSKGDVGEVLKVSADLVRCRARGRCVC